MRQLKEAHRVALALSLSLIAVVVRIFVLDKFFSLPPRGSLAWLRSPADIITVFAVAVIMVTLVWGPAWRRDHRKARGLCPVCGYHLKGNASGVCPECGERIPPGWIEPLDPEKK